MKAKLVVVGGDAKAAEINLKLPTIIGRGREAPLMLPHPLVSRQHCEIFEQNGQLVVRDLGSLNGTFINNERITEAVLPNGELLTIGTVTFRAVYDDKGVPRPAKSPPARHPGRSEKTVSHPSDPTLDVNAPEARPAAPTVAKPASKAPAASKSKAHKTATPAQAAPVDKAAGKSGRGSNVGKSSKVGKGKAPEPSKTAPFTAGKDATLQVPAEKPASAAPPKKKWAETEEDSLLEFTDDEDFELGEGSSVAPAIPSEFTMDTARPAGFPKKTEDPKPAASVKSNEMTSFPGGDLTTNFDAKQLAEEEQAKKAKQKEEAKKKPPAEEPKKGNLSTDEDLEAFFKSLG